MAHKEYKMTFGGRLKTKMAQAHVSAEGLAMLLDISPRRMKRYMEGISLPSLVTVVKICKILKCPIDELIGWEY